MPAALWDDDSARLGQTLLGHAPAGGRRLSVHERGDAAHALFDKWYEQAVAFVRAQGSGDRQQLSEATAAVLETWTDEQGVLAVGVDDFLVGVALENAAKVVDILVVKPKLAVLVNDGSAAAKQLLGRMDNVLARVTAALVRSAGKGVVMDDMAKLVINMARLRAGMPCGPLRDEHLSLGSSGLAGLAKLLCDVAVPDAARDVASRILTLAGEASPSDAAVVRRTLAARATDSEALKVLWMIGGFFDDTAYAALSKRVEPATNARASYDDAHSTLVSAVLFSLYDALVDRKSYKLGDGEDDLVGQLSRDDGQPLGRLLALLGRCDSTRTAMKEGEGKQRVLERQSEMLELLEALLELFPASQPLASFVLREPLTLESTNVVATKADVLPESIWSHVVLPAIQTHISRMPLQGVSGDQLEQHVIDLLRHGVRVFYVDNAAVATPELGRSLFRTVIDAMRHGYIETERFPSLAATICARHADEGAIGWLPETLTPAVCHRNSVYRGVYEMLLLMVGIDSSLAGGKLSGDSSALLSAGGDPLATAVLAVVANAGSLLSLQFLHDMALNYGDVLVAHEATMERLTVNLDRSIDAMIFERRVDHEIARKLTELLRVLAHRVPPSAAAVYFNLTLKAMSLLPGDAASPYSDDALVPLIRAIPPLAVLSQQAVHTAAAVCGPPTRVALARIAPHLLLLDVDVGVRRAALEQLRVRPDLLTAFAHHILMASVPARRNGSGDNHELDLLRVSVPLLRQLALTHAPALANAVLRLLRLAKLSKTNNPDRRVDRDVAHALDDIAVGGNHSAVVRFAASEAGRLVAHRLEAVSGPWKNVFETLLARGIVGKHAVTGAYTQGDVSQLADEQAAMVKAASIEDTSQMETMAARFKEGDLLGAMRTAVTLRTSAPLLWSQGGGEAYFQQQILPGLLALAPAPEHRDADGFPVYSAPAAEHAPLAIALLTELCTSFPELGGQVITGADERGGGLADLYALKVKQFLDRPSGGEDAAVLWLTQQPFHFPHLFQAVERKRRGERAVLAAPASAPPVRESSDELVWIELDSLATHRYGAPVVSGDGSVDNDDRLLEDVRLLDLDGVSETSSRR